MSYKILYTTEWSCGVIGFNLFYYIVLHGQLKRRKVGVFVGFWVFLVLFCLSLPVHP